MSESTTEPTETSDVLGITCGDIGGVFQQNYDDGQGVCAPADPRPACHLPPDQQDPQYLAELTLDPPRVDGTLAFPSVVSLLIGGASNRDCWRLPPG
jgi:hypothetical protein